MKLANKATSAPQAPTQYVPLDNIVNRKELHYRPLDADHVDMLAADIAANGLDSPLFTFADKPDALVRIKGSPEPVPATYLVAGNHRRAALLKFRRENGDAFKKRFPNGIPVIHVVSTVAEAMCKQLRENVNRREMTAEDIFPVLEILTNEPYKMTGKEIAKRLTKSTAWVSQMMAVNEELDDETKTEVNRGEISPGAARKLAAEVRATRKSGGTVTKEEIREKAAAVKSKAATGAQRATGEDRRVSLKKLYGRYQALVTKMSINSGRREQLLENMIRYTLGSVKRIEAELRDEPAPSKVVAKPAAKK